MGIIIANATAIPANSVTAEKLATDTVFYLDDEVTSTAAQATSIEVTGLDAIDETEVAIIDFGLATMNNAYADLYLNGDTTNANYLTVNSGGAGITTPAHPQVTVNNIAADGTQGGRIHIMSDGANHRVINFQSGWGDVGFTGRELKIGFITWTTEADLTAFRLTASQANGMQPGSWMKVYRTVK